MFPNKEGQFVYVTDLPKYHIAVRQNPDPQNLFCHQISSVEDLAVRIKQSSKAVQELNVRCSDESKKLTQMNEEHIKEMRKYQQLVHEKNDQIRERLIRTWAKFEEAAHKNGNVNIDRTEYSRLNCAMYQIDQRINDPQRGLAVQSRQVKRVAENQTLEQD